MEEVMRGMLAEDLSREGNHEDAGLVKENEQKDWTDELIGQIAAGFTSGRLPMYVLTNRQKMNGAACMFYPGVLEDFGKKLGRDFYLLPSSVHEVILLPDTDKGLNEALKQLIWEVNRTKVAPEEVLSDALYRYDRANGRVMTV